MIWGTALTRAYELESHVAIYPRIIVDTELMHTYEPDDLAFLLKIKQDNDGVFFIDYLNKTDLFESMAIDWEKYFYDMIIPTEDIVNKTPLNLRVIQKINWHNNYVNDKIKNVPKL